MVSPLPSAARTLTMWCADIVLDLRWFIERKGKLGAPAASIPLQANPGEPALRAFLYGDEDRIRHLRVRIETDDHAIADHCLRTHVNQWVWRVEIASLLATPTFTTCAKLAEDSASFVVGLMNGDENVDAMILDKGIEPPLAKADLVMATNLLGGWRADFENHLTFLSRFLNSSLPPDVRWHNGYRLLEWHFLRGEGDLQRNDDYRAFLNEHGAALDVFLHQGQTRWGLMEEIRALAAHALSWSVTDPRTDGGRTDPILKTFSVLEGLVAHVMNKGTIEGCEFRQNMSSLDDPA
jgi:hypothetical protein